MTSYEPAEATCTIRVFPESYLNAQSQGSGGLSADVQPDWEDACMPVNNAATSTLPVSRAQIGLKFTAIPMVQEEKLHVQLHFGYFCNCISLSCFQAKQQQQQQRESCCQKKKSVFGRTLVTKLQPLRSLTTPDRTRPALACSVWSSRFYLNVHARVRAQVRAREYSCTCMPACMHVLTSLDSRRQSEETQRNSASHTAKT